MKRLLFSIVCMLTAICSYAQTAKAVVSTDEKTITFYYDDIDHSTEGTVFPLNEEEAFLQWMSYNNTITTAVFDESFKDARPTYTYYWFACSAKNGTGALTEIKNIEYLNTSEVVNMNGMFYNNQTLTSLDLSSFNTENVTDIRSMFNNCQALKSIDLSSFNTANVTNMEYMFRNCYALETIYASEKFVTDNVTSSTGMFIDCNKLKGGAGTEYNTSYIDATYARIDGDTSNPGYFTKARTAKAVVNTDEKTITFYYDNKNHSAEGTVFSLTNSTTISPGWDTYLNTITTAVFDESFKDARPKSTFYWFGYSGSEENALKEIKNIEYLNTSEVINMDGMFSSCHALTSLDLSGFNTENVTNMSYMFSSCYTLESLDLSSFNTANVTDMEGLFGHCYALKSLNLSSFNTTNVRSMVAMFWECRALKSLNLSNFNTANVTNMSGMFMNCPSLTSLNLSSFDTRNVTNMTSMFHGSEALKSLNICSFNTANVTDMGNMFNNCSALETIYVSEYFVTDKVTYSKYMFTDCTNLKGGAGTGYNSSYTDATYARNDGGTGAPGYLTEYKTAKAVVSTDEKTITFYHDSKNHDTEGTVFSLPNNTTTRPGWHKYNNTITTAVFDESFKDARPISTFYWFGYLDYNDLLNSRSALEEIKGIENLNTSEVMSMNSMFAFCRDITSIDLSHFDTRKVTNMASMFGGCQALKEIDLSSFNTENVTDMTSMFTGCEALKEIDLSNFNTEQVTVMSNLFSVCTSLESVDLSSFNTEKTTEMGSMFYYCSSLKNIDLKNFNTYKVTNMSYMFSKCTELESLDLSSFNTANIRFMDSMFADCTALTTIYASEDFVITKFFEKMFENCTSIQGGEGTTYTSTYTGSTYARIDGGTSEPGYFTKARTAKAVVSADGKTITFYYDNNYYNYDGNEMYIIDNALEWYPSFNAEITTAVFDESFKDARPTSTMFWFGYLSWDFDTYDYEYAPLKEIKNIEYLNTSMLKSMSGMFANCPALTSIDLSNFDTKRVTNMNAMFQNCKGLESIDLSNFDTKKVTDMSSMFDNCESLKSINLSNFKTDSLTDMSDMFQDCKALKLANLSSFNTKKVEKTAFMFYNCPQLSTIYASEDFVTTNVTKSGLMFFGCKNLRGEKGTTYDENHTDAAYAKLDGGTDAPGYFSEAGKYQKGDVNRDGKITMSDANMIVNMFLSAESRYDDMADVNNDMTISMSDANMVVNMFLNSEE